MGAGLGRGGGGSGAAAAAGPLLSGAAAGNGVAAAAAAGGLGHGEHPSRVSAPDAAGLGLFTGMEFGPGYGTPDEEQGEPGPRGLAAGDADGPVFGGQGSQELQVQGVAAPHSAGMYGPERSAGGQRAYVPPPPPPLPP